MQSTDGSWKDLSLLSQLFSPEVESSVSMEGEAIAVLTYLIMRWIEKNYPQKQYTLVIKKAKKFVENRKIDNERLNVIYDKYL
jgi:hypothetical protein